MHGSLELRLVWKSPILLCARDWTLLGSFRWAQLYTCYTVAFGALEGNTRSQREVGLCVSKPSMAPEV